MLKKWAVPGKTAHISNYTGFNNPDKYL